MNRIPKYGSHLRSLVKPVRRRPERRHCPRSPLRGNGIRYFGPIDGHNLDHLIDVFEKTKNLNTPRLIHVITTKGKGYNKAEKDPLSWHGPPKAQFVEDEENPSVKSVASAPSYTDVYGDLVCELARADSHIVAITAAMCSGTGLTRVAEEFPDRFYDVGIAEQHAVTMAAGMALGGLRPLVTIYSTFLQRAFDQVLHDVCIQNIPVIFAMDRAGIVGADGATHQGLFDISFLRPLPNMILMAPSDELEMHRMFRTALALKQPCAIRYPRGKARGLPLGPERNDLLEIGKARLVQEGREVAILAYGTILDDVRKALPFLERRAFIPLVADMRFCKPLDGT
jgi:1-deoxy-D-xylulose-5-phosphate synthase